MEKYRDKMKDQKIKPGIFDTPTEDMMEWIRGTFSLDYFNDLDEDRD